MISCVIIDDDKDTRDIFSELLNFIGFEVIDTGKDGKDAEKLYKKHHPNIIFVDLTMPKYDGFYAIEKIRKIDPNAKIVIVTGDLKAGEYHLLESYAVTAIIYKPFDVYTVKQVLTDAFMN